MPSILDWSKTPINNQTSDTDINWAELQNPDTVNNSARAMMARIAEWRDDLSATQRTSTGSAGAYVVSTASAPTSLTGSFVVWFIPNHANSGPATLKVNSFAAKPLRGKSGTPLAGGEILADVATGAVYNETEDEFLLINSGYHVIETGPEIAGAYNTGDRVGDVKLTLDVTPKSGRIRLGETTQTFDPVAYPELDEWLEDQGSPWGVNTLPSAAGYFLRFASTSADIDTDGPRAAGTTQADQNKAHTHGVGTLSGQNHQHTYTRYSQLVQIDEAADGSQSESTSNVWRGTSNQQTNQETVVISGATAEDDGGDEVRTKNVTMHADLIASTSEANVDIYAVNGIAYAFDDGTTDADPGAGQLRFNNATLSSATELYISETGYFGEDLSAYIATWDDSTSAVKSVFKVFKVGAPANYAIFHITATLTDNGTYDAFTVSYVDHNGSFSDGDPLAVQVFRTGQKGDAGPSGGGIKYDWDTGTTDADPGAGNIRVNNATIGSATEIYLSTTDANSADVASFLDSLDGSTSTVKATLQIAETTSPENYHLFQLTAVTTASGYRKLSVTYLDGNGSFDASDGVALTYDRTGDKGDTGSAGTDPGLLYQFSTTTTDSDPGAGYLRANNASLASATVLYIADEDREGNDHEATILTWDDVSNATTRGQILISTPTDGAQVIYNVTGASTDATGYTKVTVTYSSGATSFADDAAISVQFVPSGNDGAGAVDSVNGDTGAVIVDALLDANGEDAVLTSAATTPVNEITVANADTGSHPSISATGDDTNINLDLAGKGTGVVRAGGVEVATISGTQTLTNKTLTSPTINSPALGADSVDAITEIAAALKSGDDATLITGTAGTNGNLAQWNGDGDLVDGPDVLDEDDMSSDSATAVPTQQSVKAYVDANAGGGGGGVPDIILVEEVSNGTDASGTQNTWNARQLNTEKRDVNSDAGALSSGAFTLAAGTWFAQGWALTQRGGRHKTRIRQTSGTATTHVIGLGMNAQDSNNVMNTNMLAGVFTLASPQTIEFQHFIDDNGAGINNLGVSSVTENVEFEVYSCLMLTKVS